MVDIRAIIPVVYNITTLAVFKYYRISKLLPTKYRKLKISCTYKMSVDFLKNI
jgi:hypothetical protein